VRDGVEMNSEISIGGEGRQERRNVLEPRYVKLAHVFAGVTRAGAASRRPYEEKIHSDGESRLR
jgi:hypothetical protein